MSRTGYTGDLGYELWIPAVHAADIWDQLMDAGKAWSVRPAGMLALDVTRLEAGLILLEVDYTSARHAMNPEQNYSPFEIGLGRLVSFDKADYVGRRALQRSSDVADRRAGSWASSSTGTTSRPCTTRRACRRRSRRPRTDRTCRCSRTGGPGRQGDEPWLEPDPQAGDRARVRPARFERVGARVEVEWTVEGKRGRVKADVVELPFLDLQRKRS